MTYYHGMIKRAVIGVIMFLSLPSYAQTHESGPALTSAPDNMSTTGSWKEENRYWRQHYPLTSYYSANKDYSVYEPAYQYGVNAFAFYNGQRWENIDQLKLSSGWEKARGTSNLTWDQAQNAARDAYMRMYIIHNNPAPAKQ